MKMERTKKAIILEFFIFTRYLVLCLGFDHFELETSPVVHTEILLLKLKLFHVRSRI